MAPSHLHRLPDAAAAAHWLRERVPGTLHSDSRALAPGDGLIAWPGQRHDARRFVPAALQAGAAACVVEADAVEGYGFADERIAALPQLATQAGVLADAFFAQPSRALDLLAITGTNGKTSTSWWLAHALALLGRRCAVIGTLGAGEPFSGAGNAVAELQATGLTTPDAVALQRVLRGFVDGGVRACAIEASSIGLQQHRLAGCHIRVALFSNLTQDHLDHHRTMAAYWAAKRALFDWPGLHSAVVNIDDAHGRRLAAELRGAPLSLYTCSSQGRAADLRASAIRHEEAGLAFELHEGAHNRVVRSRLIGDFNVANLLLVVGGLRALGVPLDEAVATLVALEPVPGRMQRVTSDCSRRARRGRRLRPHRRRAGQGAAGAAAFRRGAGRAAVVRVRLRRQPRRRQARADGRRGAAPGRPGGADQRQPARRATGRDPGADRRRHEGRHAAAADHRRPPRGHRARAAPRAQRRCRAGGRQGPRNHAGNRRPQAHVFRRRRSRVRAAPTRARSGHDDARHGPVDAARRASRSATAPRPSCACTATAAACSTATCSSRCAATASTAMPSWARRGRPVRWPRWPSTAWPKPACRACRWPTRCRRCRPCRRPGGAASRCR